MMKNYDTAHTAPAQTSDKNIPAKEAMDYATRSCEVLARTGEWRMTDVALEDLIQDTIFKALKYWDSYDPAKSKLSTWISRIAKNCYKDASDKEMRRRMMFRSLDARPRKDDEDSAPVREFAANWGEADREAETNEAVDHIEDVIDSLPENQRYILGLHLNEEMKPRQMAEQIGCTANAASLHLCRARKTVRERLGEEFLADYGFAA